MGSTRDTPSPSGAPSSACRGTVPNSRVNEALARAIRPLLSSVAMAIGELLRKRARRTSAARCGSSVSAPAERLITKVRDEPGLPSLPKATRW